VVALECGLECTGLVQSNQSPSLLAASESARWPRQTWMNAQKYRVGPNIAKEIPAAPQKGAIIQS
jgi:hypothetical protein